MISEDEDAGGKSEGKIEPAEQAAPQQVAALQIPTLAPPQVSFREIPPPPPAPQRAAPAAPQPQAPSQPAPQPAAPAAPAAPAQQPEQVRFDNPRAAYYHQLLMNNPNVRKGLYLIRAAEGTQRAEDPYRTAFGFRKIDNLDWHPQVHYPYRNTTTTAAGAYQFLKDTWNRTARRLGLKDFSPLSQDIAALDLIRGRRGLNALISGDFPNFIRRVRGEWASFPGAGYRQPEVSRRWLLGLLNTPGIDEGVGPRLRPRNYAGSAHVGRAARGGSSPAAAAQALASDGESESPTNPLASRTTSPEDNPLASRTSEGESEPGMLNRRPQAADLSTDMDMGEDEEEGMPASSLAPSALMQSPSYAANPLAARRAPRSSQVTGEFDMRLNALRQSLFGVP